MKQKIISVPSVLVIGNVGVDAYPDLGTRYLGGSSFNLAWNLHHLKDVKVDFLSRIGRDEPGNWILQELKKAGFPVSSIYQDDLYSTSIVNVHLNSEGIPAYQITEEVAADHLTISDLKQLSDQNYHLLTFGTKLLRKEESRKTVLHALEQFKNVPLFWDLNFRKDYLKNVVLDDLLASTSYLKLNKDELVSLSDIFKLQGDIIRRVRQLAQIFPLKMIVLTQGDKESILWTSEGLVTCPVSAVDIVDTVGAGDAFSAMMIKGILAGWGNEKILKLSTQFAGAICGIKGAIARESAFYEKYSFTKK
ncbi:MAG: PfkB family carbohydrate kinase [Candidatus Margulisbacteria bacterium]|nr:PfkB family carbohydrate kinase [Candidatus Margulisiibacteriota bacterium]